MTIAISNDSSVDLDWNEQMEMLRLELDENGLNTASCLEILFHVREMRHRRVPIIIDARKSCKIDPEVRSLLLDEHKDLFSCVTILIDKDHKADFKPFIEVDDYSPFALPFGVFTDELKANMWMVING